MATGAWQPGYNKSIVLFGTTLKVTGGSWVERVEKIIVTHSQSGGVQGWIATILDGDGSVQANVDASAAPPNLLIVPGAMGFFLFTIGSASPFIVPIGISEVHYQYQVATKVEYSFNVSMNSESGSYTRAA